MTTLLFGLVPAWLAGRVAPNSVLKSKGTNARRDLLRRRLFIPAQFSLALALASLLPVFLLTRCCACATI